MDLINYDIKDLLQTPGKNVTFTIKDNKLYIYGLRILPIILSLNEVQIIADYYNKQSIFK